MTFIGWLNETFKSQDSLIKTLRTLINPAYSIASNSRELLRKASSEWYKKYQLVLKVKDTNLPPDLLNMKRDLSSRGSSIMSKISAIGFTGDVLSARLGALPLIGATVIVTSAGMMLYWTLDFIKFRDRLAEYKALRARGVDHKTAVATVDAIDGTGFIKNLNSIIRNGAIIGGGIIALHLLTKKR